MKLNKPIPTPDARDTREHGRPAESRHLWQIWVVDFRLCCACPERELWPLRGQTAWSSVPHVTSLTQHEALGCPLALRSQMRTCAGNPPVEREREHSQRGAVKWPSTAWNHFVISSGFRTAKPPPRGGFVSSLHNSHSVCTDCDLYVN